jgi:predicted nucleic acid-binding protein
MADALFDTTVFIDYYRGDAGARALINRVLDGALTVSYSALTGFEIWLGITNHEEEIDFLALLDSFEEAPLRASAAIIAASWLRDRASRQSEALIRDALIAATASERQEPIYTRNVRDFRRLYDNVETY